MTFIYSTLVSKINFSNMIMKLDNFLSQPDNLYSCRKINVALAEDRQIKTAIAKNGPLKLVVERNSHYHLWWLEWSSSSF